MQTLTIKLKNTDNIFSSIIGNIMMDTKSNYWFAMRNNLNFYKDWNIQREALKYDLENYIKKKFKYKFHVSLIEDDDDDIHKWLFKDISLSGDSRELIHFKLKYL